LTLDVVSFNESLENGEAVTYILDVIESVNVDTCDFNFITGSGTVDQISKTSDFFLARNTTWRYRSGSFLNSHLLVVFVNSVLLIKSIRTVLLAKNTFSQVLFAFENIVMISRTLKISTDASEIHL
jgi:hypothetical protein